ncbi:BamA/TamA family outer membrane protein [Dinghuibacter silviterrae]|uniref:Surface antigen-like protein n=1 Tax=Dinghuibacter silviterrae TaxID=1539049 RepID=A0A4V3GLV0_9BACT|nr:BamA/TamA family outer membrane protein [Dinghuibacter silviterrae]TDX00933.1 surface antigen-like protein [Dinghuibacter silviterrae]
MKVSSPRFIWLFCLVVCYVQYGCYRASHYQKDKPFVFKNNIELTADVSKTEKKAIVRDLAQQLDDSLTPTVKDILFLRHTVESPAVYDTSYPNASLKTMRFYMVNQGFFSPELSYTFRTDTVGYGHKRQYRVTTDFSVQAGPQTLLDSIVIDLRDSTLQHLADSSRASSLLVHGQPFNVDNVTGEINRLIGIYKNYGYYGISQDAFQVQLDTVNPLLINPSIDPLERIHLFAGQQRQQKNPTTDLYLSLASPLDSNLIKKYYIRQVFIYPDFETTRDNKTTPLTGLYLDSINLRYHTLKFKPSFLLRTNFLKPGDLYRQDNYDKTLNTVNFLGVWQVPIIQAREVKDTSAAAKTSDSTRRITATDSSQAARTFLEDSLRAARSTDSTRRAALNERVDKALASMDTTRRGDTAGAAQGLPGADTTRTGAARAGSDTTQPRRADTALKEDNESLLSGGISHIDISYKAYAHRRDTVGLLDFYYLLTPAKKQNFNSDLEINYSNNSNNQAALASIPATNLFGADADVSITNRNVGKEAISMTNAVNGGVEVSPEARFALAAVDMGYTNTITIPRFITPFRSINRKRLLAEQTVISGNFTFVERIGYFNVNNFNFKYGYQWKNKPAVTWSYNPIDIEYSYLYNVTHPFDSILNQNPYLRFAYTDALIMAQNGGMIYNFANRRHPNRTSSLRANLETSGLLAGIIKRSSDNQQFGRLFQYIKPSLEYIHQIKYPNNNSWDFRLFSGVGIPLGGDSTLPFFKQFVAGGPNSMRGWGFRSLGPGATHLAPYSTTVFNDRFGDIQFEGNIEYRYNIAQIIPNSLYLKGAIFTDIGNVWDFKKQPAPTNDSATLDISHLYQELAVDAGLGFRLDFNYFVLRFDFGFRFKKPDEPQNDGWQWPGINLAHVFGRSSNNKVWRYNNYNFSFGINYSF